MSRATKKYEFSDFFKFHGRQAEAFKYVGKGHRLFFGGARGGGKSAFALATAMVCAKQFPGIVIVCIRKRYFDLQHTFIFPMLESYPDKLFGYRYLKKDKTAEFNNGSRIIFKACDTETDAQDIQGVEFQLMIIDEANNLEEMVLYKLVGSLRKSKNKKGLKGFKPSLIMTGNPGGRSDLYFKTRFIEPNYSYWQSYELKHKDRYIFVPSGPYDNPYLDEDYISWLEGMPYGLREAWLEGNWDVFHGQFFEEWNPRVHIVESFDPPAHWERVSGMDLGFTDRHPTVFLWGATDPETGVLHIYREAVLKGDVETQAMMVASMQSGEEIGLQLADPSMFSNTRKNTAADDSPDMIFAKAGIALIPANNDRINGWRIVKQWLHWDKKHRPRIVFHDSCPRTIEALPTLRHTTVGNLEDMDTKQNLDDFADALRYMLVSGFFYEVEGEVKYKEWAGDYEKTEEEDYASIFSVSSARKKARETVEYSGKARDELIVEESTWRDSIYESDASMFI